MLIQVQRVNLLRAKEIELEKLAQFQTYEEVANKGHKALTTRWVISDKHGQTKARLAVRGFEDKDLDIQIVQQWVREQCGYSSTLQQARTGQSKLLT